jgi:Fic family protein
MNADDRHSVADSPEIIVDPDALARQEAENGIRQYNAALDVVRNHVNDRERPFKLRPSHILMLNREALSGIDRMAGAFRNTGIKISKSNHVPPDYAIVPEEIERMCDYVNDKWSSPPCHLAAYLLWRLNWIHPFVDGNGRTSRMVSYMVLSIRMDGMLPGVPTIPEQIATDKGPYYSALEQADAAWASDETVDVSALEKLLEGMLAQQLYNATQAAAAH